MHFRIGPGVVWPISSCLEFDRVKTMNTTRKKDEFFDRNYLIDVRAKRIFIPDTVDLDLV